MQDRQPGAPGQYKATLTAAEFQKMQAGEQFTITMVRDDQPIVEGTPYSKAAVLPDALAAIICPDVLNPTPADALGGLLPRNGKAAMTSNLPMGGHRVTGLGEPAADGDAVPLGFANDHFARAGYGYGGSAIYIGSMADESALETALETVYSAMTAQETKMVTYMGWEGWRWFGILSKSSANNGSFVAHSAAYSGTKIIKTKYNGAWLPLEWENPPMLDNTEYRTIERWGNKPVYRKSVKYTNDTVLSGENLYPVSHGISNLDITYGVEIVCRTTGYQIPYIHKDESTSVSGCTREVIQLKTLGNTSWSAGRTWYFDMKYVKTP